MRKILCYFLVLTMLIPLTACRENTAEDENILRNLYTQMTDEPLVDTSDSCPSNVVLVDGKYYTVLNETNYEAFIVEKTADAYEEKTCFIVTDENGDDPTYTAKCQRTDIDRARTVRDSV